MITNKTLQKIVKSSYNLSSLHIDIILHANSSKGINEENGARKLNVSREQFITAAERLYGIGFVDFIPYNGVVIITLTKLCEDFFELT